MTLTEENTNITPRIGIKKAFEENILTAPINPPSASEPVSPINTLAFPELKIKNPRIAKIMQNVKSIKELYSSFNMLEREKILNSRIIRTHKKIRYTRLVHEARPSSPSVRLTLLVIAIKVIATKGIVKIPRLILDFTKGR